MNKITNNKKLSEFLKTELKREVMNMIILTQKNYEGSLTYREINAALIDILHENNQHDPKEPFKNQ